MNDRVIDIRDVIFSYPRNLVLRGLTMHVPAGGVMGLLGANGAGKTTLMYLLNGYAPPQGGRIRILGLDPWREREKLQRKIAYVPEHPVVYDWITVRGFLKLYERLFKGWDEGYVKERLAEYEIPLKQKFASLSRGQQGIVSLVTALGRRPELLLLDDPTRGLDVLSRRQLYRTIVEELSEIPVTILFATHLPAEVEGILTHASFISGGHIVRTGEIEELKSTLTK